MFQNQNFFYFPYIHLLLLLLYYIINEMDDKVWSMEGDSHKAICRFLEATHDIGQGASAIHQEHWYVMFDHMKLLNHQ